MIPARGFLKCFNIVSQSASPVYSAGNWAQNLNTKTGISGATAFLPSANKRSNNSEDRWIGRTMSDNKSQQKLHGAAANLIPADNGSKEQENAQKNTERAPTSHIISLLFLFLCR